MNDVTPVMNMPIAISVRNLRDIVVECLQKKHSTPLPVPSIGWIVKDKITQPSSALSAELKDILEKEALAKPILITISYCFV